MRILVLEDNRRFSQLIGEHLADAGYVADLVETVAYCRELDETVDYDLYLIDLTLPDGDGIDLIRELRRKNRTAPVLIITARAALDDRVLGLDAGADDYLVKPFNHLELLARIRAVMRRSPDYNDHVVHAGNIALDIRTGDVACDGHSVCLRPSEKRLFALLLRNMGRTVPREAIANAMKSFEEDWSANAIDKVVSRLRKALGPCDAGIEVTTVRGIGYMLEEPRQ